MPSVQIDLSDKIRSMEGRQQKRSKKMEGGRRAYRFWTEEEEAAIIEGVKECGERGQWSKIKDWSREMESDPLKNRTAVRSYPFKCVLCVSCPWWVQRMV